MFNVMYVSAVGIGFGVAGAILLARGILTGPDVLEQKFKKANYRPGSVDNVRAAEDWADGALGCSFIAMGFVLQAVAIIGQTTDPMPIMTRVIEVIFTFEGFLVVFIVAEFTRWPIVRWYLRRRAHYDRFAPQRFELPSASELIGCGIALGKGPGEGEERKKYLKRVWKIDESR